MFSFNVGGLTKSEKELLKKMSDNVDLVGSKIDQANTEIAAIKNQATQERQEVVSKLQAVHTLLDQQVQISKELQAKLDAGASTAELGIKVDQLLATVAEAKDAVSGIVTDADQ